MGCHDERVLLIGVAAGPDSISPAHLQHITGVPAEREPVDKRFVLQLA